MPVYASTWSQMLHRPLPANVLTPVENVVCTIAQRYFTNPRSGSLEVLLRRAWHMDLRHRRSWNQTPTHNLVWTMQDTFHMATCQAFVWASHQSLISCVLIHSTRTHGKFTQVICQHLPNHSITQNMAAPADDQDVSKAALGSYDMLNFYFFGLSPRTCSAIECYCMLGLGYIVVLFPDRELLRVVTKPAALQFSYMGRKRTDWK